MISATRATVERSEDQLPGWIDSALVIETKVVWAPHIGRELTDAEATEILMNVGRLLDAVEEDEP